MRAIQGIFYSARRPIIQRERGLSCRVNGLSVRCFSGFKIITQKEQLDLLEEHAGAGDHEAQGMLSQTLLQKGETDRAMALSKMSKRGQTYSNGQQAWATPRPSGTCTP